MKKLSHSDPTSLGAIISSLGYASDEQLQRTLDEQQSVDVLMGKLLVADGVLTLEELEEVIEIQKDLRGKDKFKRAMAASAIALKSRGKSVGELAQVVSTKTTQIRQLCLAKSNGNSR